MCGGLFIWTNVSQRRLIRYELNGGEKTYLE